MSTIVSLAHVCLKSTDLAATARFYCEVLGLKKGFDFKRGDSAIGFYLKASANSFIEVFLVDAVDPCNGTRGLDHFCLETSDIESTRKSLLAHGYAAGEISLGADHSYQFWVKDPSGVDVEFHQYTDRSTQFTGQDIEVNW